MVQRLGERSEFGKSTSVASGRQSRARSVASRRSSVWSWSVEGSSAFAEEELVDRILATLQNAPFEEFGSRRSIRQSRLVSRRSTRRSLASVLSRRTAIGQLDRLSMLQRLGQSEFGKSASVTSFGRARTSPTCSSQRSLGKKRFSAVSLSLPSDEEAEKSCETASSDFSRCSPNIFTSLPVMPRDTQLPSIRIGPSVASQGISAQPSSTSLQDTATNNGGKIKVQRRKVPTGPTNRDRVKKKTAHRAG